MLSHVPKESHDRLTIEFRQVYHGCHIPLPFELSCDTLWRSLSAQLQSPAQLCPLIAVQVFFDEPL